MGVDVLRRGDWHTLSIERTLSVAGAAIHGLSVNEAALRLRVYGPNRLTPPKSISALRILRDQLVAVVVVLLLAAAVISLALGDFIEAAAIFAVLVINAVIGFLTEWRARRAMDALRQLDVPRATVLRAGHVEFIDADRLVPGDLIEVSAGHAVPADARLITTTDLRINEAALTGESLPVSKTAEIELDAGTGLADRTNMVFKGTTVAAGFGRGVVTATGSATEVGRIGELTAAVEPEPTPLERRLDALGRRLAWLTLGIAAIVGALEAAQGTPLPLVIETAIALAVAAVPEALPAVATIALAVGMWRMARRGALVRRLPAVETLGSTTVVCTDKTRTLTSGDMAVVRVWTAGRSWDPLDIGEPPSSDVATVLEGAALASRPQADGQATTSLRDPVDAAIVESARTLPGLTRPTLAAHRLEMIPFTSERKWMAAFYLTDGPLLAFVKGAPRGVLERSSTALTARGLDTLDDETRANLVEANDTLAAEGLRVLGVASGSVSSAAEDALHDLTFLGFIGLADPPAPGVADTIARLRTAGLRTVMLTGDQRLTAVAIGRAVGVLADADACIDGRVLEQGDGTARDELIARTSAFSRVTPEHKLTIVRALQSHGEIVAMLGDGINDAAALKRADVGVAMGTRGTDIAKEAAAIVLRDDRFETIAAAVEEGRIIFDNIRKCVFYLFSCNVAEVLVLLIAGLASLPLPLTPLQLLWLNLVTDTCPALALALEPGDTDVMLRPPRDPDAAILSRAFLLSVAGFGLLITFSTVAAFMWALAHAPERAPTMAFMTLALAQIAHLGNARSPETVLQPRRAISNPYALLGVGLALTLQAMTLLSPLSSILSLTSLELSDWIVVVMVGSIPAIVGQAVKAHEFPRGWRKAAACLVIATAFAAVSCEDQSPTQPAPVCAYTVAPATASFTSDAGSGTVAVTAALGCSWSAATSGSWISITAGATGSGSGIVSYAVTSNGGTPSRSGQITVAGQTHSITQQGRAPTTCTYDLSPDGADFSKDEARDTFTVSTPDACAWTAASTAAWLVVISGGQGTGPGTVSYSVARNTESSDRTANITVADKTFRIRQAGDVGACQFSVAPVMFNPCMPAGTVTTTVTTQAGCSWTVSSNVPWLTIPGGSSGTGTAPITLSFSENYDSPREGLAMVRWPTPTAGQNVRVSQAGCLYGVSQSAFAFTANAGSGTFNVIQESQPNSCGGATQDRCIWTATSDVPWIVVTSPMPRAGDNPVGFTVTANTTGSPRVGRLTVRDKVVVITQDR